MALADLGGDEFVLMPGQSALRAVILAACTAAGFRPRIAQELVGFERARAVVLSYDYTVLAGTQGFTNHKKKDRIFELAARRRLPVVVYAEGGGGWPGATDGSWLSMLDVPAFELFAKLSALVPLVGIVAGWCIAGNAALLGLCVVIIAVEAPASEWAAPR